MPSTTKRGNYYRKKTMDYYRDLGYTVILSEINYMIKTPGGMFFKKFDILGADCIAYNDTDFILINSKATTPEVKNGVSKMKSSGKIDFAKYQTPPFIKKHLAIWLPKQKPIIVVL